MEDDIKEDLEEEVCKLALDSAGSGQDTEWGSCEHR
jgi:hypothetical protein